MYAITGKRILLGVTGGIAAYKAAILIRLLRKHGADVRVVMTANACKFITPLTLETLSANSVYTQQGLETDAAMEHIKLARWADLILIAPASANFIARYKAGLADDLLSTLCLAANTTILIAPAMNQQMWLNATTQDNVATLKQRGLMVIGPAEGTQACGEYGPGRMLEPEQIIPFVNQAFLTGQLDGRRLLVTAGPTQEPIDPVRYISNRSSGRMGYAIAEAALEAGANVSIISGPVAINAPEKAMLIKVNTATQMYDAVMQSVTNTDIFIANAAVADYRLQSIATQKIKKRDDTITLELIKNPDILATVAALKNAPFTVGFAAETEHITMHAQQKLQHKNLNMIAANQVGAGQGFESDTNALTVFWNNEQQVLPQTSKATLARNLINLIAERYHAENHPNKNH